MSKDQDQKALWSAMYDLVRTHQQADKLDAEHERAEKAANEASKAADKAERKVEQLVRGRLRPFEAVTQGDGTHALLCLGRQHGTSQDEYVVVRLYQSHELPAVPETDADAEPEDAEDLAELDAVA